MTRDNVSDTVKAIAKFIAERGIHGMLECRDNSDDLYLSRAWSVGDERRSFEVYLYVSSERGDRFESEGAVFRPLKVRASVTTTGTSMTSQEALAYGRLLSAVANLAADLEYTFDAPVYECLVTAEQREKARQVAIEHDQEVAARAHVQEAGKGLRVGRAAFTKTTLPEGEYPVEHNGKKYTVRAGLNGACSVERTA